MERTMKCSTVLVSRGKGIDVYRSVDEVPPEVRRRFLHPSGGLRTGTILIADRRGREHLLRMGNEPEMQDRPSSGVREWWREGRAWVEIGAICAFGAAMWALFAVR